MRKNRYYTQNERESFTGVSYLLHTARLITNRASNVVKHPLFELFKSLLLQPTAFFCPTPTFTLLLGLLTSPVQFYRRRQHRRHQHRGNQDQEAPASREPASKAQAPKAQALRSQESGSQESEAPASEAPASKAPGPARSAGDSEHIPTALAWQSQQDQDAEQQQNIQL